MRLGGRMKRSKHQFNQKESYIETYLDVETTLPMKNYKE